MMHGGTEGHWGFGFGHWGLGLLFWLIIFLLVAALVKYIISGRN